MKKLLFVSCLFYGVFSFSHGGDKLGPHGGYVEMPGLLHTEVVPDKDSSFHIYLLDIEFKNPTVKNSDVQAWLSFAASKDKLKLKCETMEGTHFHCIPPKKITNATGLIIKAKREQAQSNEVTYKLPLKLPAQDN